MCHGLLHTELVPSMYCSYLYNFPLPSRTKDDWEGLIKGFLLLITAHLHSSWSYFSSPPSHFVKFPLKAPGWLGFWGGTGVFRISCSRVLREKGEWIAQRGWGQLPDDTRSELPRKEPSGFRCLMEKSHSGSSFLTWFRSIEQLQLNEKQMV